MNRLSDNLRGALFMTAAMLAFLSNDSFMKAMSDQLPLLQAITVRGLGTTVLLLILTGFTGGLRLDLSRRDWALVGLRTVTEAAAAYFFIAALFHMPIANATAILQALPLAVTLAGALFLREPVGWRRLAAIVIGFAGVLLIVQPGPEGFNVYAIHALISVAAVTVRDLATRRLSPGVPSMTVAVVTAAGVTAFAGLGSLGQGWVAMDGGLALQMCGAVGFVILGYLFSIRTMRTGEIAFVAPFRYTSLLFSLIAGILVFGEWPTATMLAGSAVVVATGLFTLYRETRVKRPDPAAALRVR